MNKPWHWTALMGVGLVGLMACTSNTSAAPTLAPPDKQILRVNDITEPNSYDPTQQTFTYEAAVGRQVFETLLKANATNTDVTGSAAESYTVSSDGLTYTFKLRSGAKWSDGKPVTSADWMYGFRHFMNPALAAGYVDPFFDQTIAGAGDWGKVDVKSASAIDAYLAGLGLSAPDANTFVIKLDHAAAYFKWVVTLWVAVPIRQDVVEAAAGGPFASTDTTKAEMWAQGLNTIIGQGVFKISEIVAKDHVTVVPNKNYWGTAPKLQKVIFYFIADGNTAFSQYRTGALDQINVPIADVTVVRGDAVLSKQAKLLPRLTGFWMDYNQANPILANEKVRMALSKSINRDQLVTDVQHGVGKANAEYLPNGMGGYDTTDQAQSFDPAAAKALLVASGVSMTDINSLKLKTRNTTGNKTINQFIVAQWNTNLGTNIQLDVVDSKTVTAQIRKHQFDIYGPSGWGADYPDQQDWMDVWQSGSCGSLNFGCPVLSGYDAAVAKADAELNANARDAEYLALQHQLVDTAAGGFLYQQYEYDLIAPYVANLTINAFDDEFLPGDQNYQTAYITTH